MEELTISLTQNELFCLNRLNIILSFTSEKKKLNEFAGEMVMSCPLFKYVSTCYIYSVKIY